MNMMTSSQSNTASVPAAISTQYNQQPVVAMATHPQPVSMVTTSSSSPLVAPSPGSGKTTEVQPLTNVFVPLESIKPGKL